MNNSLIKAFWACGDNEIIEYAMLRARLNRREKKAVELVLGECMTQEQAAEHMDLSVRHFQQIWTSAVSKLLAIPWVAAYARCLINHV